MKKGYQEMWAQRVVAEKLMKKGKTVEVLRIQKKVPYYQFLVNESAKVQGKQQIPFGEIFKRWVLHSNQMDQFEKNSAPQKKVKIEGIEKNYLDSPQQKCTFPDSSKILSNSKGRLKSLFD
eukprot:TRINITY_DN1709_c0_g1_i1.p3 TRINITY_DN1709_c0_g1~~TRINITY_DN1709_c0_g1_i1.p3  ORF type:complete len:121 (+),score=22.88 TRINITY_DN1709_c0_g1_i1:816-1178(+)